MADTAKLKDMVDNLIDQKGEQAQVNFHDYIKSKMGEVVGGGAVDESDIKDNEE